MTRFTCVNIMLFLCLFLGPLFCRGGTTIYVDASNKAGPWDGATWPTAYMTLTNGAHQLMVANQVSQGGHLLSIASGVYTGNVSMTNHSGLVGATNVIACTNPARATVIGGFSPYKVSDIKFEGLNITGPGNAIYCNGGDQRISIIRCNLYANTGSAIYLHNQSHNWYAENCNIYANAGYGVFIDYCSITLKDCNIVGNGIGVYEQDDRKEVGLINCNVYGNAIEAIEESTNLVATVEELNSYPENTNCIMANPGFSDLDNNWNFNEFYTNSPCYGAGESGGDIGLYQNAPSVPVSSNTYYVALAGNDSRTKTEAVNPATPWASITNAAARAVAGDTVIVNEGVYNGQVNIVHGGADGLPVTYRTHGKVTIDGAANGLVLDAVNSVIVDGFDVTSCTDTGISVYCSFMNTLNNISCSNASSAGLAVQYSNRNTISNCLVHYCNTYGIYQYGCCGNSYILSETAHNTGYGANFLGGNSAVTSLFDRCLLHHNTSYGINIEGNQRATMQNCNIYSNNSIGIRVYGCSPLFESCDIVGNANDGLHNRYWRPMLINCIIADNGVYGCDEENAVYDIYLSNCCFHANTAGNFYDKDSSTVKNTAVEINALPECGNNIVEDPLFRDQGANDYRIVAASPCVNAGTTNTGLTTDLYGQPRLTGSALDIGSYELPAPGTVFIFTCQ